MAKRLYGYRGVSKGKFTVDPKAALTPGSIQTVMSYPAHGGRVTLMETTQAESADGETVRKTFELYLSGMTSDEVAQRLNDEL
jgi:hypothetical protein